VARGCRENVCALIGGETAQMPGFYQPGEYDVSGTIVGVVDKSRMIDGKSIRPGDALISRPKPNPIRSILEELSNFSRN
jgi:phosphoribosylformylglycinamidine cyclo-ligase